MISTPADLLAAQAAAASGSDPGQYVTFQVGEGIFAVPLAEVQEIIRMPDVVLVPLSHRSLEGLANLRGTVMSVTSLRRIFGEADVEHDDATRVVVLNQGMPIGFVVDRMAAVVTASPDQIESVHSIQATIRTDMLRGLIKAGEGRGMIMILDPVRLLATDDRAAGRRADRPVSAAGAVEAAQTTAVGEELQLVSFEVAGQEYALAIESVQEIVQVPPSIVGVPKTDAHVLGVMTLRNRLLPLVGLREMFGLPPAPLDDRSKIVVVPLPDQTSVGIVMDLVKEVLRVDRGLLDAVPPLLQRGAGRGEIEGICRMDGGKRLVAVLSAAALFENGAVRRVAATAGDNSDVEDGMASDPAAGVGAREEEEQFVVFRLADEEYGVPIGAVQEIVRVPEQLTRLPKAPAFIKGVVNLRGSVLPVVDQRARFQLDAMPRGDRQRIMVFAIGGVRTGFIVDSVSEVLRIPRGTIGPMPALSDAQARLISRVANLERQHRMILLIDTAHLLEPHEIGAIADASAATQPLAA